MNNYIKFDPTNPPPPLMISEPDSFAYRTMTTRIFDVIENVLTDHSHTHSDDIKIALHDLCDELRDNRVVKPLQTTAPDERSWLEAWQPYHDITWLNCPWYFAEAFFYRRLLEAAGYFGTGAWAGVDPYLPRKEAELKSASPWQLLSAALNQSQENSVDSLAKLLHRAVWGNRVDLSYTKIADEMGGDIALERERANLLVDDTEAVLAHLQSPTGSRCIDFICDNTGTELLMDLALVDFLLRYQWTGQITLHVKAHPTFVSDTTLPDINMTIAAIKAKPATSMQRFAARLESFRADNRLLIETDLFWNSSRFFWEMPPALQQELAQPHLIIIKGDANYRRLLGDSRWLTTVPIADAAPYLPAPFVALRTMKSDPIVGLEPGQAEVLDQEDPEWRVNGRRGMIQALLK